MRNRFDEQLDNLTREMITMGMYCETAISTTCEALLKGDCALAQKMPEQQERINQKAREIENLCFRLLMQQQPVARDLRVISSALKMVTDLERIGVQSADIGEIIATAAVPAADELFCMRDMSEAVIRMVTESVNSFVNQSPEQAAAVIAMDDVVDDYFVKNKSSMIEAIRAGKEISDVIPDLLMVTKYLERIGDHAANVAKWVLFAVTGKMINTDTGLPEEA